MVEKDQFGGHESAPLFARPMGTAYDHTFNGPHEVHEARALQHSLAEASQRADEATQRNFSLEQVNSRLRTA